MPHSQSTCNGSSRVIIHHFYTIQQDTLILTRRVVTNIINIDIDKVYV